MRKITVIMGDGIGPEVVEATIKVVHATGVKIEWERVYAGMTAFNKTGGDPLPNETLNSIEQNRVALKGPCDTPIGGGFASVNVALRKKFDLYANIRPIKSMPGVKSRYEDVDLVIFRENIEDIYGGEESYLSPTFAGGEPAGAEVVGTITRKNSRRLFCQVYNYALNHHRKHLTIVHKANILKKTQGLFLETGKEVFENYPTLAEQGFIVDDKIIDNMSMQLVLNPTRFDMIAATNMFGDILSDLCAGLVGGLGLAPGANIGDTAAIFEAVHGTAPDIAGKNLANPTALILSAAMMLDYIGESVASDIIRKAVGTVIYTGKKITKDIQLLHYSAERSAGTSEMADAIAEEVSNLSRGA